MKRCKTKTSTIKIAYEINGKPTILSMEADIVGALAVHPTPGDERCWTVTHHQSGRAIFRFFSSAEVAMRIAQKLGEHPGWTGRVEEIELNERLKALVNKTMRLYGDVA